MNKDLVGQSAEHVVRHIVLAQKLAWFYLREYNPLEDLGGMSHDFRGVEMSKEPSQVEAEISRLKDSVAAIEDRVYDAETVLQIAQLDLLYAKRILEEALLKRSSDVK